MTNNQLKDLINRLINDEDFNIDGKAITHKIKKMLAKNINEYFGKYLNSQYVDDEDVLNDAVQTAGGREKVIYGKDDEQIFTSSRKKESEHGILKKAAFVAAAYYLYKKLFGKKD